MRPIQFLLSFFGMCLACAPLSATEVPNHSELVLAALDKHIIGHVRSLKDNAANLPKAVEKVCRTGEDGAWEELKSHFRLTVEAYAGVDFLRFGPMQEGGRRERLSFWPDPRGSLSRQLRLILLSKDEAVLAPGAIGKQSVAVQGLPALEVLILDKEQPLGPGEASQYRCKLAFAIATNIAIVAQEVDDGWEKPNGWRDKMLRPGSDNDTYKEPGEAASELVKALLTGFALTADQQLKPQIDPKLKIPPPYSKGGLQRAYFQANIQSLQGLYDALDLERFLPESKDWVKNWVGGAWRAILSSDGYGGVADRAERDDIVQVREVFDRMNGIRKLIVGELSVAAQLTVGFNELDGD